MAAKPKVRTAPPPPPPKPVLDCRPLAERVPTMTEDELKALQVNAERMALVSGARQEEAKELLPLLEAELKVRKGQRAEAAVEKTKATAAKRAAATARRRAEKADRENLTAE